MKASRYVPACLVFLIVFAAMPVWGSGIPIQNWTPKTNADLGHTSPFQAITPCRLVDTRSGIGGVAFGAGETRGYVIPIMSSCSGIPVAEAYSLSFTILGYSGSGWITAWPTGATKPTVSTVNFGNGAPVANAATVPANLSNGSISVYSSGVTHLLIDINGYYTNEQPAGRQLFVKANLGGGAAIYGHNDSSATGSHGVGGYADGVAAVHGVQGGSSGTAGASGVHGYVGSTANTHGVYGTTSDAPNVTFPWATFTHGVAGSGYVGVAGNGPWAGVAGMWASGTSNGAWAYLGWTSTTAFRANGDGEVTGNFNVGGTLTKAAGSFKIDHPLDPQNKYLYHSFVESPDMKNIYDGTAILDSRGEAMITMPDWFEALNEDFRYQLTAIGHSQPNLYIADEIMNNRFRIAGGRPYGKVSWTVTGIRHDPYAVAHRIPITEEKVADEVGTYLHPLEYGQPIENGYDAKAEQPDVKAARSEREAAKKAAEIKAIQNH